MTKMASRCCAEEAEDGEDDQFTVLLEHAPGGLGQFDGVSDATLVCRVVAAVASLPATGEVDEAANDLAVVEVPGSPR